MESFHLALHYKTKDLNTQVFSVLDISINCTIKKNYIFSDFFKCTKSFKNNTEHMLKTFQFTVHPLPLMKMIYD